MTSFFGKIPDRGDFVRINVKGREPLDMGNWLESALEPLRQQKAELPAGYLYFIYRQAGARNALVGVMKRSQDKVGRTFPAAIFSALDMRTAMGQYPLVPAAFGDFFDSAEAVLKQVDTITADELEKRLNAIRDPGSGAFSRAGGGLKRLMRDPAAQAFNQANFGPAAENRHYYAYYTLNMACKQAQKAPDDKPGIILNCPCQEEAYIQAWLELVRICAGNKGPMPSVFWSKGEASKSYGSIKLKNVPAGSPPKLYVAFNAPPALALALFTDIGVDSNKLWPLFSDHKKALELTKQKLTPQQLATIDNPQTSLEAMISVFA